MPSEVDAVTPVPLTHDGLRSALTLSSVDLTYTGFDAPGPFTPNAWIAAVSAAPNPRAGC